MASAGAVVCTPRPRCVLSTVSSITTNPHADPHLPTPAQDLDEAGADWRVYFELIPATLQFKYTRTKLLTNFKFYGDFAKDAANGDLATYSAYGVSSPPLPHRPWLTHAPVAGMHALRIRSVDRAQLRRGIRARDTIGCAPLLVPLLAALPGLTLAGYVRECYHVLVCAALLRATSTRTTTSLSARR